MQANSLKGKKAGRNKKTLLVRTRTTRKIGATSPTKEAVSESLSEALGESPLCPSVRPLRAKARSRPPRARQRANPASQCNPRNLSFPRWALVPAGLTLATLRCRCVGGKPQETPPAGHFWSGVRQFVQIDLHGDPKPSDAVKQKAEADAAAAAAHTLEAKAYCIIPPGNSTKVKWDLLLGLVVLYSVMIVPFRIGFGIEVRRPCNCRRRERNLRGAPLCAGRRTILSSLTQTHPDLAMDEHHP